jgi:hypothetical protein
LSPQSAGCTHFDQIREVSARTGHPIVRSAEPGESWSWCYADEAVVA